MKRAMDLLLVVPGLILCAPILLLLAVVIRVSMGAPVLFRQKRAGKGGRAFELIKFRTMRLAEHHEAGPEHDAAHTTAVGAFLRKSSLDELPTLLNVFKGHISLVGPRPLLPRYEDRYSETHRRRLDVEQGITGWAQINGNTDFESTPGCKVAYHAPCHLRAQSVGFKGRDLMQKIPGVVTGTVMECCGHNGTYAMTVEGFEPSQRIGTKDFDGMKEADAELWVTDCPLAALQFAQHAGRRPMHPMSVLARAYRSDGFAVAVAREDEESP